MKVKNALIDWTFNDLWKATGLSLARKAAVIAGMGLGLVLNGLVAVSIAAGMAAGTAAVLRLML